MQRRSLREGDLLLRDADVDQTAAERAIIQRLRHRLVVPGRVNHDIRELTSGDARERGQFRTVPLRGDGMRNPKLFAAESQPGLVHVEDDTGGACYLDEFDRGEADWTGADYEHMVAGANASAVHRVAADG